MKPSRTSHILRQLLKSVGSDIQVSPQGLPIEDLLLPSHECESSVFRDRWFAYNLMRKREVPCSDLSAAAIRSFKESELQCRSVEEKGILGDLDWPSRNVLLVARRIAHDVLGPLPNNWYSECNFTGGASTSRRRSESHPAFKWWASPPLDVTPRALKHLLLFSKSSTVIDSVWRMPTALCHDSYVDKSHPPFRVVRGSRLETVPKNYKTDRCILIEPDGNMLLQKGLGNIIRKRLKRVNIDLNDQRRNQRLAFAGSISGSLGTIDIAQASDSTTLAVLRLLLPWDWYRIIFDVRSPEYFHDGEWAEIQKVSSMGNGFTFELESLVFYALARAVVEVLRPKETRVGIYGDDIIVASSVCGYLEVILRRCGYSLNKEKSYWRGAFRESCGKHYHNGLDVTPVHCKADLDCPGEIYRLYNQVRGWARQGLETDFDVRFDKPLRALINLLKQEDRIQVPLEYSPNCGLYYQDVSFHKVRSYRNKRGWHMLTFYSYEPKVVDLTDRCEPEVSWLYRHMERWLPSCPLGTREYTPFSLVREGKRVRRLRVSAAACFTWPMP